MLIRHKIQRLAGARQVFECAFVLCLLYPLFDDTFKTGYHPSSKYGCQNTDTVVEISLLIRLPDSAMTK
jgi:hypothetical protein